MTPTVPNQFQSGRARKLLLIVPPDASRVCDPGPRLALIAQAGLRKTGELIGLQLFIGEREQVLDLLAQL